MTKPLGVGLVGRVMGRERLGPFRHVPGVEVTCGYGITEGLLGRAFSELGMRACSGLGELLAYPSVDTVNICIPESQHLDLATTAIQADEHVLIERPLTSSRDESQSIDSLVSSSKRYLRSVRSSACASRSQRTFQSDGGLDRVGLRALL